MWTQSDVGGKKQEFGVGTWTGQKEKAGLMEEGSLRIKPLVKG